MDTKEKVTIGIYRNPSKRHTMYINDIRVYGMEPLFEPPVMSFEIEKELISGALDGKTMYDLKKKKEKKIEFKDLKKGDTVVVHNVIDNRTQPFESTVKTIGKKRITTTPNIYCTKFDPIGSGSYGWSLFPGNMEKYNEWVETKQIAKKIYNDLFNKIYRLSKEELAIIEKMISE